MSIAKGDQDDPSRVEENQSGGGTDIQAEKVKNIQDIDLSEQVKIKLNIPDNIPTSNDNNNSEILEEISDDMLHMMERTSRIENSLSQVLTLITELSDTQDKNHREQILETGKIKTELLSERKVAMARSTFNAVVPAIESLHLNMGGLDPVDDNIVISQMRVVTEMLNTILQSLGFLSFRAEPGDVFDPENMECVGYAEGPSGRVVEVENSGYRTEVGLIKPCRVVIGAPVQD